jgi:uncharacterized protein
MPRIQASLRLVLRIDDEALGQRHLPLLAAEPAVRLVEQPFDLAMLARDTRDREPRALPDLVMVDLGDGSADPVLELRLRRADVVPLLLQRVRVREVQLAGEHADIAACHGRIIAALSVFELIDAGDAQALRELLQREPDAAAAHDEQGLTAVMRAAYRGPELLAAVLEAKPPLEPFDRILAGESDGLPAPDARTPDGFTGLHVAAFAHNVAAARALLEAGADPDAISTAPFATVTPLGTCAFAGANEVARVLLEHDADPDLAVDERARPAVVARSNGNDELAVLLGG